jgi:hypothetical protein
MMRSAISFGFLAMVLAGPALANGAVDVAACRAMKATLAPRQAEISELTEQREASALLAEEAGIAWEDAEIHRLVSAAHAATADRELAAYDAAKKKFARDELALQSAVKQFNADVAVYNTRCSPKG